jgi:tRNA-modifying protein YgfZ
MIKSCYCAIIDFTAVQIIGQQAKPFLQGQFTCDVRSLTTGHAIPGACCDHKGRVQFNGWIGKTPEDFILFLPTSMAPAALQHLGKFAVFSKIKLVELANWSGLNVFEKELPKWDEKKIIHGQSSDDMHWYIGESTAIQQLQATLEKTSQIIDSFELARQRILNRLVFIEPATQGLFTPQMIELEKWGGVSFNKGCYVGQEVVAKTQYLGQLKRHLQQLKLAKGPQPQLGDSLVNEQKEPVGNVAATCPDSESGWLLLAVIQDHSLSGSISYHENKCVR